MTVSKLIEKLRGIPQEIEVVLDGGAEVTGVEVEVTRIIGGSREPVAFIMTK